MVSGEDILLVKLWLKVRDAVHNGDHTTGTLAFPDLGGAAVAHLERKIQTAAKDLGYALPTATEFRKDLEVRNKRLEGPAREAVSRHLSHSSNTAAQYYQSPTQGDSLATFRIIGRLIDGRHGTSIALADRAPSEDGGGRTGVQDSISPPSKLEPRHSGNEEETPSESPPAGKASEKTCSYKPGTRAPSPPSTPRALPATPAKRKKFMAEETESIMKYFASHFEKGEQPTLGECREFLEVFDVDRQPKHIQDKCRNIMGRH